MNPGVRFSLTLFITVLVWSPGVWQEFAAGNHDLAAGSLRFLIVFTIVRVAMGVPSHLYGRYAAEVDRARAAADLERDFVSSDDVELAMGLGSGLGGGVSGGMPGGLSGGVASGLENRRRSDLA
jgi:hypothetical protein